MFLTCRVDTKKVGEFIQLMGLCILGAFFFNCSNVISQTYPTRPIRLIVPYSPGGATDILARMVASKISIDLGQQVIVENRSGAGSVIGTQAVANAENDGYTLGFFDIAFATNPSLLRDRLPYDSLRDFIPISLVAIAPLVMVVHPSIPARNVAEFIMYSKNNPSKINYSSGGVGSGIHLAGEQFKFVTGTDILHISYKGAGPGISAILSGEVQLTYATPNSIISHVKSGRVILLAILADNRINSLPDVPTVTEVGLQRLSASPFLESSHQPEHQKIFCQS